MLRIEWRFFFRYRVENALEWKITQIDSDEIFETEIANLNPGQSYEVMVLSQDERGEGMFSRTIKVTTKSNDNIFF